MLHALNPSGIPKHKLRLKKGTPVLAMRNMCGYLGICNGTRMIVKEMDKHIIMCEIRNGSKIGEVVGIPRITMEPLENTDISATLVREQFPLKVVYSLRNMCMINVSCAHL